MRQFIRHLTFWQKYLTGLFLISALFLVWPEIDLKMASFFYDASQQDYGFTKNFDPDLKKHRKKLVMYMYYIAAGPVLAFLIHIFLRKKLASFWGKRHLFFVISLILGPVILTNVILKENWGRARPYQTAEFQRDKIFTPAWVPTDQCERNCSFVSGDVSFAAWFTAFLFFARRRRWQLLLGSAVTGLIVYTSYLRVSMGAHFLSDVILATYMTIGVNYFCYWLFIKGDYRERFIKLWRWIESKDKRYQRLKNRS